MNVNKIIQLNFLKKVIQLNFLKKVIQLNFKQNLNKVKKKFNFFLKKVKKKKTHTQHWCRNRCQTPFMPRHRLHN